MNKDIKDRNVKVLDTTGESVVMADQSQIQQIVLNLLLNALSAVPKDTGIIEVSTVHEMGKVYLDIKDNGKGIPEDKLDKIFDPFFSMTAGGTGLGLSVVFTLLKQNSIEHEIVSRENEGTLFSADI